MMHLVVRPAVRAPIDGVVGQPSDLEVDNQWQVIRGDTRKRRAYRRGGKHLYAMIDEHVVAAFASPTVPFTNSSPPPPAHARPISNAM